jgi:hypothetical protein
MSGHSENRARRNPWFVRALVVVIALLLLALGLVIGFLVPGLHPAASFSVPVGKPIIVSEQQLRQYGANNPTVYWDGPMANRQYELTRSSAGASFIRYLPEGVKAGSENKYLTVATYPQEQGYKLLDESSNSSSMSSQKTKTGALVVINSNAPASTYFSFPGANFQVEVFSPTKDQSKQQVLEGKITILGAK